MRNRTFHANPVFFILTLLLALAFTSGHARAGQDDAAIDKVRLDFNAAYNESSAQALARLLDRDAVWMPPGEPTIVGRDSIEARYTGFFARVRSTFELKAGDIQTSGNWAYLSGDWGRTDTPKAGGTARSVSGHYLLILKKQPDGAWKISRDIWNELVKP